MHCPKCHSESLSEVERHGITVDLCSACHGMWLEHHEIDALEDHAFDADDRKGSMIAFERKVDHHCPECKEQLYRFDYRYYDLELEYCPNNHGFWLDEGEDERILALMEQKITDQSRKAKAERQFQSFMESLRGDGFFSRIKRWFK